LYFSLNSINFFSISCILSFIEDLVLFLFVKSDDSILNACFSISNCHICFSNFIKFSGIEVIHIFTLAAASSNKSIALSGNLLSGMYLILSSTAATTAASEIFSQW